MLTYKIHLIRHGMTQANLEGRYAGRTDSALCPQGKEDLIQFAQNKTYPYVDKVFTSPSTGCHETAEILFPSKKVHDIFQMQELDFGDFEGKTLAELKDNPAFETWSRDSMHNAPPDGEDGVSFIQRVIEGFDVIFQDMMDCNYRDVAVIVPGGIIMMALALMGFPRQPMGDWQSPQGGGYTILMTPELWMRDRIFEIMSMVPTDETIPSIKKYYYEDGEEMFFE